jgi:hypothetical protein
MPITRKQLAEMLIKAFEELNESIDTPNTFQFKGFNQSSVDAYLEDWLKMSQDDEASLKMGASYDHSNETIQVWFYYNDYHNKYYDDDSNSAIGISDAELTDTSDEDSGGE